MNNSFSAKLLLFGEYSVLAGSDACAFPLSDYSGKLLFPESWTGSARALASSNRGLHGLLMYLNDKEQVEYTRGILNLVVLEQDIQAGLAFQSNIPRNYGIGSSGALVAALYGRYKKEPLAAAVNAEKDNLLTAVVNTDKAIPLTADPDPVKNNYSSADLQTVRTQLAFIESAFHSKSSGTDPLVSYLNKPVFIRAGEISCPDLSLEDIRSHISIDLIDSGLPGVTKSGVQGFQSNFLQGPSERKLFEQEYMPLINTIVGDLFKGNYERLTDKILRVSEIQLQLFPNLFPPGIRATAQQGLDSGRYAIKLCGSGGGGYFLKFQAADGSVSELS